MIHGNQITKPEDTPDASAITTIAFIIGVVCGVLICLFAQAGGKV